MNKRDTEKERETKKERERERECVFQIGKKNVLHVCVCMRERKKIGERERQRERQTDRQTKTNRIGERETERKDKHFAYLIMC